MGTIYRKGVNVVFSHSNIYEENILEIKKQEKDRNVIYLFLKFTSIFLVRFILIFLIKVRLIKLVKKLYHFVKKMHFIFLGIYKEIKCIIG